MCLRRCVGLVFVLGLASPAAADEARYTPQPSDSLESLGRHYYGASWKGVYIAARNGVGAELPVGKAIAVPACWLYKVKKGDSLAKLAKRYLGDSERFVVLQAENDLPGTDLQPGGELLMPFVVAYVVQAGDSLSGIAQRFYRNKKKAQQLADYNRASDKIEPGAKLYVPIFDRAALDPRAKGAPPRPMSPVAPPVSAEATSRVVAAKAPASEPPSEAQLLQRLEGLIGGYQAGRYDEVCGDLEALLTRRELALRERGVVLRYLGFCAVAFDDTDAARDYFRKWVELDPKAELDPVSTSPRILSIFAEVKRE